MKKTLTFFVSIFLIGHILNAQIDDTKAKEILNKVSIKIKSYTCYKIDFTYKMENAQKKINEVKTGSVIIKGNKYYLDITGQIVICDGKTTWAYIKDANEVNIDNVRTDDDAINPTKLMDTYNKNYKCKLIKKTSENGKYVQIINLTPIKGKKYFKVRLTIDKAQQQIISSIVYDKDGTTYTYLVTKFTSNIQVTDANFIFNKTNYPDVEINDMR